MATVILRPTADASLNHSCSSGSSGYALISEATADGDSTYIYQTIEVNDVSTTAVSIFKIGGTDVGKVKISSIQLTINAKTTKGKSSDSANLAAQLTVNGNAGAWLNNTLSTSYGDFTKTYSASDLSINDVVLDSFDSANITVQVETSGKKNAKKNDDFQNRITQVYLTVEYEPVSDTSGTGIYLKQNGAYTQAQAAYKKVSGAWVQQTDIATLKTEMQSGKYKLGG